MRAIQPSFPELLIDTAATYRKTGYSDAYKLDIYQTLARALQGSGSDAAILPAKRFQCDAATASLVASTRSIPTGEILKTFHKTAKPFDRFWIQCDESLIDQTYDTVLEHNDDDNQVGFYCQKTADDDLLVYDVTARNLPKLEQVGAVNFKRHIDRNRVIMGGAKHLITSKQIKLDDMMLEQLKKNFAIHIEAFRATRIFF